MKVRLLTEKVSDQPESHDDKEKIVEYSIPSWQVIGLASFASSISLIFSGSECS